MSHTQVFCKQKSLNAKDELGSCLLSALIWAALDLCLTSVILSVCKSSFYTALCFEKNYEERWVFPKPNFHCYLAPCKSRSLTLQ